MTPGRRTLQFDQVDQILPEVDRLLEGHETVGNWSLAQICQHLAAVMNLALDLPASKTWDPADLIDPAQKRQIFETGRLPEGLPLAKAMPPPVADDPHAEAATLRAAVARYLASDGPAAGHRLFGPLSKAEWDRLQCVHCAHHLSFVVPKAHGGERH